MKDWLQENISFIFIFSLFFIILSIVVWPVIFAPSNNIISKIQDEPDIGTLITLDKHTEIQCTSFDLHESTSNKQVSQVGTCSFIKFSKIIGGDQIVTHYYTLKVGQVADLGYKRYKFNGYSKGQFLFEDCNVKEL